MRITKLFPARRTAVLMLLVLASSMTIAAIAGVSGRMMIVDNIVANNVAATPYLYDSDILTGVAVEKPWYPSLEIGANGHGYMIWAEVPTIASQNHTLRFRSTNNLITDLGARHNWSSAPSLPNVNQNYTRGFVVGAPSKNGTLNVFFSNSTGPAAGFENNDLKIWDGTRIKSVESITTNWTATSMYGSKWLKAPCGQILFDENDTRYLAWNDGTTLKCKIGNNATQDVDTGGLMSEFIMLVNSTGGLHFVYSMALSNDNTLGKEIYWCYRQISGAFSPRVQLTSNGFEDTRPHAIFDSEDNLLVTWSGRNNATGDGREIYTILYKALMSPSYANTGIEHDISDSNTLTLSSSSPEYPSAYQSQVFITGNGELHFVYSDTRQFESGGSQGIVNGSNMMWQSYPNSTNLDTHSVHILTDTGQFENLFFDTIATNEDDLFCAFLSRDSIDFRLRFVKMDDTIPTPTITDPAALAEASSYSINKPPIFNVNFTLEESDIAALSITWDSTPLITTLQQRNLAIDPTLLGYGEHALVIYIGDEVGNTVIFTRSIQFLGIDPWAIIAIVIVVAIAVPVILILAWFFKNRIKLEKRALELKLGGKKKAPGEEGWSDEEAEEEGEKEGAEDVDLKKDLKKADI